MIVVIESCMRMIDGCRKKMELEQNRFDQILYIKNKNNLVYKEDNGFFFHLYMWGTLTIEKRDSF